MSALEVDYGRDAAGPHRSAALRLFLRDLGSRPLLTQQEERSLSFRARGGDRAAREEMVIANLPLVLSIAKNYRGNGFEFADLVQEGAIGLVTAVEKFDPTLGYRFSTYATNWIRQACQRALQRHGSTIRAPESAHLGLRAIRQAEADLTATLRRVPSRAELADATGLEEADIAYMLHMATQVHSVTALTEDGPVDLEVPDEEEADPVSRVDRTRRIAILREILAVLPQPERAVVERRFGLAGQPESTRAAVASHLGLTRARTIALESQALDRVALLLERARDAGLI